METMILGSPSSPASPETVRISNPKQFLPGYLLGTSQTPVQSSKSHHIGETPEIRSSHRVTWSPDLVQMNPRSSQSRQQLAMRERFGGPPVRGLSIDAEMPASSGTGQSNQWQNASFLPVGSPRKEQTETNYSFIDNQRQSVNSSTHIDPFYTQGEDFDPIEDLDECCVTVFGFPPHSASYILQEFARYGVILNYEIPNKCNWMHLRFQTKLQAKKSLSKNTKIFNGTIQIGVTLCIDKEAVIRLQGSSEKPLMETAPKRLQESNLTLANASFVSASLNDTSLLSTSQNPKGSMRSLTAAYTSPSKTGSETDMKSNDGLMNKAWQYMFGF